MKLFACPSPPGTNYAGLYLNEAGRLVDRHGGDWGRSPRRTALDALPPDLSRTGEKDHERRMQEMRGELEKLISDDLDLDDAVCAEIVRLLDKHVPWRRTRQAGPDATRGKGASDAHRKRARDEEDDESDLGRFKAFLKAKGLSAEHIQEALRIVDREAEEAEDVLPVNALRGKSRDDFERRFPEVARVGADPEREMQVRDRYSKRARRQAMDQATRLVAGEASLARKFGENFTRIKTDLGR
jgi:hypothetical protein